MTNHTTPTLTDTITYILESTTDSDLDRLTDALRQRQLILRKKAAAALTEGSKVETCHLKPKYLNNLTGHIKAIEKIRGTQCAVITLDEESTATLACASPKYVSLTALSTFDLRHPPRRLPSDHQQR